LDGAARDFNVERIEQNGLDPELEAPISLAGPTVQLVSPDPATAPLVVAFSAFPGLHVRLGRWCRVAVPACGCDDCRETIEGESERLRFLVDSLIAGRFREELQSSGAESGWYECEFWSSQAHQQQRYQLDRDDPRLRGLGRSSGTVFRWKAWPRRGV
jgi:hypothetical protein